MTILKGGIDGFSYFSLISVIFDCVVYLMCLTQPVNFSSWGPMSYFCTSGFRRSA